MIGLESPHYLREVTTVYTVFFDSGIGGLNTLKHAIAKMPDERFIYFGDTANVPYGTKSPEEIINLMRGVMDHLQGYELKAFVIACNTATSVAAGFLRERYSFPVIGMEPAVKPALAECEGSVQRVLLLATILTLKSERIAKLLSRVDIHGQIDTVPCSELVEFAERLEFDTPAVEDFLRRKLVTYDLSKYGSVVLGSTHFNYFSEAIRNVFPAGTKIMDGNAGTVNQLARIINYSEKESSAGSGEEILLHLSDSKDLRKIEAVKKMIHSVTEAPVRVI